MLRKLNGWSATVLAFQSGSLRQDFPCTSAAIQNPFTVQIGQTPCNEIFRAHQGTGSFRFTSFSLDGSAQPTKIPDLGICGLSPTGAAIRKVDKAVARFVEEPRSQHHGRAYRRQ